LIGLNPLVVGILAGVGSAVGDLTSYLVGFFGTAALQKYEKRTPNLILKLMRFFKNFGFWLILLFAFLPSPFDFIGVASGVAKYDIKKFLLALIIGRTARSILLAYGTYYLIPHLISV
jgi:membrane protein YqaA with SNARE-associated domain